jgi:hypothetical protein
MFFLQLLEGPSPLEAKVVLASRDERLVQLVVDHLAHRLSGTARTRASESRASERPAGDEAERA